ncbi:MAG: HypC/HybG/HupF family hydrogenase formation chaperone [Gammaproteobacteria bacterium]|nr:HypC/HybG/HupF family hydrogenase formation chaperone [Gammaproteobacteria bacterium]
MCLALPGRILEIDSQDQLLRTARVSFSGLVKSVSLALVPEAQVDDYVLVHAGFAIATIDEAAAQEALRYLQPRSVSEGMSSADGTPEVDP